MKKIFKVILVLGLMAMVGRAAWGDQRDLDLRHWAQPILERFQAKGYMALPGHRPYPRDLIRAELIRLRQRVNQGRIGLSATEAYDLKRLEQELGLDLWSRRLVEEDLWAWADEVMYSSLDARAGTRALAQRGEKPAYFFRGDLDLGGGGLGRFVFDQRLVFELERERQKVERLSGAVNTWRGGKYSVDWAYLRARLHQPGPDGRGLLLDLTAGRQQRWWGQGRQGTLLLSDNAPSFDALGLRLYYKKIVAEAFAGVLGVEQQRYLSGHRAWIDLPGGLSLGGAEVVLYQAANLDPVYLNPLLPFYGNQWNQRDDDNILWLVDFGWRLPKNLYIYGELLMDDVQYEQDPPAPQKMGFLAGLHWADPLGLKDVDLLAEWAGSQKWLYTQRRHANRYVGNDTVSCLGHAMGTDADMLGAYLEARLHPRFKLGGGYSWARQGEGRIARGFHYAGERYQGGLVAPGDTVGHVYVGDDPHTAFLSGVVERKDLGHLYLHWEPWCWLLLKARAWAGYTRNIGNQPGCGRREAGFEALIMN